MKKNRIRLSVVIPSAVRWLGTRSTARQISEKEQNSSVRRHPVRCPLARNVLDGQTNSVKKNRIRLSVVIPSAVRWLGTALDGQTRLSVVIPSAVAGYERTRMRCCNDDDELDGEVVEI